MLKRVLRFWPLLVFMLSCVGLGYVYGFASVAYRLPPAGLMNRFKTGIEAWTRLDDEKRPAAYIAGEEGFAGDRAKPLADPEPDDLILVTGGFDFMPELCPEHGCIAWIMDRDGGIYHTWQTDRRELFTEVDFSGYDGVPSSENYFVQGVDLYPNGDLLVTFQGRNIFPYYVGSARIDRDGHVVWKAVDKSHHWPTVAANGDALLPWAEILRPPSANHGRSAIDVECPSPYGALYEEGFRILDADGKEKRRTLFDSLLAKADLTGLEYSVRDGCDPYHINGIDELNAAAAAQIAGAEPGDLLMSLRSPSALLVVDRTEDQIHAVLAGPMAAQHSPVVTHDGHFLVFDNLSGNRAKGGSRALELTPGKITSRQIYPRRAVADDWLQSDAQGAVRISADDARVMISETLGGRLIEVDRATGTPLWTFDMISALDTFGRRNGLTVTGENVRLQAHGADYISRELVGSVFGATAPIDRLPPL